MTRKKDLLRRIEKLERAVYEKTGSVKLPEGFRVRREAEVQSLALEIAECLRSRGQSQSPEKPEE